MPGGFPSVSHRAQMSAQLYITSLVSVTSSRALTTQAVCAHSYIYLQFMTRSKQLWSSTLKIRVENALVSKGSTLCVNQYCDRRLLSDVTSSLPHLYTLRYEAKATYTFLWDSTSSETKYLRWLSCYLTRESLSPSNYLSYLFCILKNGVRIKTMNIWIHQSYLHSIYSKSKRKKSSIFRLWSPPFLPLLW